MCNTIFDCLNLVLPNQSTCAIHHLKGLDKVYLDHKKFSGLLSISYKNLRAQFYLKIGQFC